MSWIDSLHPKRTRRNVWFVGLLSLAVLVGGYVGVIVWLEGQAAATLDDLLAHLPDGFHAERGTLRFDPWSQRLKISSLAIEGAAGQRYAASRIRADISYRPDFDAAIAILSGKRLFPPSMRVEKILRHLSAHQVSIRYKDMSVQWSYGELTELGLDLTLLTPSDTGASPSVEQIDAVRIARLTLIGLQVAQEKMRWTLDRLTLNELRAGTAQRLTAITLNNSQQWGVRELTASKIWLTPLVRAAITGVSSEWIAETVHLDDLRLPAAEGRFIKLAHVQLDGFQPLGKRALASSVTVEGVNLTTPDLPWPELTNLLERIGYRRLGVKGVWRQQWQPETGELALDMAEVEVSAMGRASLSLRLSQVDAENWRMWPFLPVDKLFSFLASAQLTSVHLELTDMGLTSRLIEDQAVRRGLTLVATRARLMEDLIAWLQANRYRDPFEPVLDGIDAFLRQPGELVLTATARQPITLALLIETLMSSPPELAGAFKMSAKYRP